MTFNPSICTVKAKPGFGKSKGEYAMPVEEWTDRVLYLSCPKNMFTSTVPEVRVRAYLACEPYHAPDDPCVVLDSCTIYYAPYFTKCRLNTDLIREEQEDLAYILMVVFA
jgi:hypothetical protein